MQFVGYFDEANIDDGFGLCGVVSIFIGFWSNCGDDEIGACVQRWKHDFRNRLFKDYLILNKAILEVVEFKSKAAIFGKWTVFLCFNIVQKSSLKPRSLVLYDRAYT